LWITWRSSGIEEHGQRLARVAAPEADAHSAQEESEQRRLDQPLEIDYQIELPAPAAQETEQV
jgi:hypothetical protein